MKTVFVSLFVVLSAMLSTGCAKSAADSAAEAAKIEAMANAEPVVTDLRPGQALPVSKTQPVVIDFYAVWCGPCKSYAPIFDKVAKRYADKAVFVRVDVDKFNELAATYGIRSIPTTVIILPDGSIKSSVGLISEAQLDAMVSASITK